MEQQVFNWTCSICSFAWVIQSTGIDPYLTRESAANIIGYPTCVNETYGLMSSQCLIDAFAEYNLRACQRWVTFDQAYAIARRYTGVINPLGMYHFMAIRGVSGNELWLANSAEGYMGVYSTINRNQFNAFGPVQIIYVESKIT